MKDTGYLVALNDGRTLFVEADDMNTNSCTLWLRSEKKFVFVTDYSNILFCMACTREDAESVTKSLRGTTESPVSEEKTKEG